MIYLASIFLHFVELDFRRKVQVCGGRCLLKTTILIVYALKFPLPGCVVCSWTTHKFLLRPRFLHTIIHIQSPDKLYREPHIIDMMKIPPEDNIQHRFELFLLGNGEKKVTETPDTRMLENLTTLLNAATDSCSGIPSSSLFTFSKEDHTLGNLLRARLLQSQHVTFAGYRVPHPLFRFVVPPAATSSF